MNFKTTPPSSLSSRPEKNFFQVDLPYFLLCFLILALLSLVRPPAWALAFLIFGGPILPGVFLYRKQPKSLPGEREPYLLESFRTSSPWVWVVPLLAAVLLRFWGLTNLLVWPQADEGFSGLAGIELSRQWDWKFFYGDGQSPPFLNWICGLLFKLSNSYFLNLWLPPAVFSVLTLLLSYLAARQFFSRSFSWLFAGLIAFSFWPLYLGRLCLQAMTLPPWEMASFWVLGKYLKARPVARRKWACGLGFIVGLGIFTYTPWIFVAAFLSLVLLFEKGFPKRENFPIFFTFLLFLILGASWFLLSCFREGYGDHISSLWAAKASFSWARHTGVIFDYFNVLFWGFTGAVPRYIPFLGGYLNPLIGALFFLGLVEAWRFRDRSLVRTLAAAFVLFLLPGLLSMNVQGLRIISLMPLALFLAALGFQRLSRNRGGPGVLGMAMVLFLGTGLFDGYRLLLPYQDPSRFDQTFRRIDKNPALYLAYQLLQSRYRESGLVFTDFTPERDQTLRGATYPFNAAWNRLLGPSRSPWAAVLVETRDVPGLSRRFPGAVWNGVGKGSSGAGDLALGTIPVTEENHPLLMSWAGIPFLYFQSLSSAMNEVKNKKTYDEARDRFDHPPEEVIDDPFLKACWERRVAGFYDYFGRH